MTPTRDPWLAANLSWSLPGLGQFYAGRRIWGWVFLVLGLATWSVWILWVLLPGLSTSILIGNWCVQLVLWIVSAVAAFRMVRGSEPPPPPSKNPWKSLFFTRFIPGLGHFTARRWIRGAALLILWGGVVFWPVPERWELGGLIAVWVLHGLVLADSYFILRHENPAPRRPTVLALTLALVCSQAWAASILIKTFVAEVFKIPSSSMEPTLLGNIASSHGREHCPFRALHDNPSGDRIMVSKLAYAFSPVRRFDVAVFRYPLNQSKAFVSRVVGLPNEEILIHGGDLFVRSPGETVFRIARKPLEIQDRIWIRVHDHGDTASDPETFLRYWNKGQVTAGTDGGVVLPASKEVALAEPIDDGWNRPVGDLRIRFEVRMDLGSDLTVKLVGRHGIFELEFPLGRPGILSLVKGGEERTIFNLEPTQLSGRWQFLELMVYDGLAVVRLDSKVLGQFELFSSLAQAKTLKEASSAVSLRASHAGFSVRRVSVDRDVHYAGRSEREHGWGEDEPLKIPEGKYLFLGDNVANSHDARAWVQRTFNLKDGRKIICESQQVNEGSYRIPPEFKQKLDPADVLYWIDGDQQGNEVAIKKSEFVSESESRPLRFVDRRFITGRVTKVWWPLDRARPVR